ncbi:hypothetical protein PS838_05155 [Pseudomonas fluorescens]|nr:hypothetical protein PS838_05155 [Pseudomonas fluorescens]
MRAFVSAQADTIATSIGVRIVCCADGYDEKFADYGGLIMKVQINDYFEPVTTLCHASLEFCISMSYAMRWL